jgi:tetratricopeptide (TPR) repeat protein
VSSPKSTNLPVASRSSTKSDLRAEKEDLLAAARAKNVPPDPLSPESLKKMGLRLGVPTVIAWGIAIYSGVLWVRIAVGVLTLALAALVVYVLRFAKKTRNVAAIVKAGAETPEARKEAIEKLKGEADKGDSHALFAKAQLEMQDDPRAALKTLEKVDLSKVLPTTADEARTQRAMIHLMLGDTEDARSLADHIDLSRHKEAKTKAMMTAIMGEALARTGAAKKAIELLETFADLKPQMLRARAFAYAWANDTKQMKQALKRISAMNPQYLGQFITKKKHPGGVNPKGVHPLLEKEAFDILSRSGAMPRKMEFRRG